ncbi:threonine--tRNA ligase [Chengkuizengella axinellae]|uniref:Threonine--tRNA ligase n=1 Tax=Chengkuizengella axinellae TaxID=3064388 RepID=A0ABT9J1H8_9BACL|nr:threonine--tRNA ligase [Chengkuizengella sp. 2205SS18-9]MDP5275476.1 threonine--tRNA ligase [Chengkuizengella sp. 2205SS18-9]
MNSNKIEIIFPDNHKKVFEKGITLAEIAESISSSLKKRAVAGKVNHKIIDLGSRINSNARIEIISLDSKEGLDIVRHTSAHVLAQAVKRIYGKVKLGVGPVIEDGFFYDLDVIQSIALEDLSLIEKEMQNIIDENLEIERIEMSREMAGKLFQDMDDELKLELLEDIPHDDIITVYKQGEFLDLCRGPHLPSTGMIKSFKLTKVSGAYWRGDSNNKMLQRIYGVSFASKKELVNYISFLEKAAKRNHKKLGQQLELFMFSDEAAGMPFYLPKGQWIKNELESMLREEQQKLGYQEVRTPSMMKQKLWEESGHWEHYQENMYFSEVDQVKFALKPMNCPGHMIIFNHKLHSYRDLPLRLAEFGQVHRHELSGALNGLLRVRTFCQDDAHIFVTPEQIKSEIKSIIEFIDYVYKMFGFDYELELSTRPDDSLGDDELWEMAEGALKDVLNSLECKYRLNEGDGAFYGPKIDFHIKDALKRSHQCATIQLDFQMPEKFKLSYVNENNEKQRPVVIHRAVLGSIDRFLGILIEHFGGAFPTWLAPTQVKIIPVSNQAHRNYVEEINNQLRSENIRTEVDSREEKLGYKIREAKLQKIPYIIIVGDEEVQSRTVNVQQFGKDGSEEFNLEQFIFNIKEEVTERKL